MFQINLAALEVRKKVYRKVNLNKQKLYPFFNYFPALEKKLRSVKQVLKREASIKDAVNDILRINDIYKTSLSDVVSGKLGEDKLNPLRPMETFQLVKNIGDMGREQVNIQVLKSPVDCFNLTLKMIISQP